MSSLARTCLLSTSLLWPVLASAETPAQLTSKCPESAYVVAQGAAARVELAYVSADEPSFVEARFALEMAQPCVLDHELGVNDAVSWHRARAILAIVDHDEERARRSLVAIKRLVPDFEPPSSLMPEGSPLRRIWDDIGDATPQDPVPLPEHKSGFLVDGLPATSAPSDAAFVLQAFSPGGKPIFTAYCEVPACLSDAEQVAIAVGATRHELVQRRVRNGGLAFAGLGLATTAVGLGVMFDGVHRVNHPEDDLDALGGLREKQAGTATAVTGAALSVVSGGAVVVFTF